MYSSHTPNHSQKAFTLLELSIVLIIISLLVGGVMAGRSLIESTKMKDLMVDLNYYTTATKAFQDKYNALPGDFAGATGVWGVLNATPATCMVTAATGKPTCNGDSDGRIQNWSEQYRFWQHLVNAELIKGVFTGTGDPVGGSNPSLNNLPATSVSNSFISISFLDPNPGGNYYDGSYGNFMNVGIISGAAADMPFLTSEQQEEVDNKMDDGKPATGNIRSHSTASAKSPNCATTNVPSTALYNIANTSQNICSIIFIPGF